MTQKPRKISDPLIWVIALVIVVGVVGCALFLGYIFNDVTENTRQHTQTYRYAMLSTPYGEVIEGVVTRYSVASRGEACMVEVNGVRYCTSIGNVLLCSEDPDRRPVE